MLIYLCPTDKRYACSWEGPSENILEHFQEEHDDLIFFSNTFNIDLNTPSENRLLILEEEIYLQQSKISDDLLTILLRYLGPHQQANKLSFDINLKVNDEIRVDKNVISPQSQGFQVNLKTIREAYGVVEYISCTIEINGDFSSSITLEELNEEQSNTLSDADDDLVEDLDNTDSVFHSSSKCNKISSKSMREDSTSRPFIPITRKTSLDHNKRSMYSSLTSMSLETIEESEMDLVCANCKTIMVPPIFLCIFGHNICLDCKSDLCKVCNAVVTNSRNVSLEEKSKKHLYFCKHKGCSKKCPYNEIREHEIKCKFCEYKCPIFDCAKKGQFQQQQQHLKLFHGSVKIIESYIVEFPKKSEFFLVNKDKGIFYCKCTALTESIVWNVMFCGPAERRFFCELKFKNSKHKEPIFLKKFDGKYMVEMTFVELKKLKLKEKNAVLIITSL